MNDRSKQIFETVQFVRRLGTEINSLGQEIGERLTAAAIKAGLRAVSDGEKDSWVDSDNEYLTEAIDCVYELKQGRKRIGYITHACDLALERGLAAALGQSVLAVCYCSDEEDFEPPFQCSSFNDWPHASQKYVLASGERVWIWKDAAKPKNAPRDRTGIRGIAYREPASWFYVVPLAAISGRAEVPRLLITPVFSLLTGTRPDDAFSEAPEVINFTSDGLAYDTLQISDARALSADPPP